MLYFKSFLHRNAKKKKEKKKAISKKRYAPSRKYGCHTDLCKSHFLFMYSMCVYNHVNAIAFTCLQNNPSEWIVNDEPKLPWTEDNCPSKGCWCCPRPSSTAGLCSSLRVPGPCRARSLPATVQPHQLKILIQQLGHTELLFYQEKFRRQAPLQADDTVMIIIALH